VNRIEKQQYSWKIVKHAQQALALSRRFFTDYTPYSAEILSVNT
jgi:hypothetical protein